MLKSRVHLLPNDADVPAEIMRKVRRDHDRFAVDGLPANIDHYLFESYGIDMSASYVGMAIKNPWGKASGQLTLNRGQIEEAAEAGLGLAVLKTVIAQDAAGDQAMSAWAIKESQMVCEPIDGRRTNESGWTITWKGRGWWQSFDQYLELVRAACDVGQSARMLIVPSVKYHLPTESETEWRTQEYLETTGALLDAYTSMNEPGTMPLEKDFSPTLAGSDRAAQRRTVLEWLRRVPGLIRATVSNPSRIKIGLKLFNSLDDDDFQLAMLEHVQTDQTADFLVYANRLFDPEREFRGVKGVAYGGPDLSDRNLDILSRFRRVFDTATSGRAPLEVSATGNISSGRIAVEYALRGCTSFQIHTFFQLPSTEYRMRSGTKIQKAIHRLYFDPDDGFLIWAIHAARRLDLWKDGFRFIDLARRGEQGAITRSVMGWRETDPSSVG